MLKGVRTAMEHGIEGTISNHGGRSLDTAPARVLLLLELQKCCPESFDRMELYVMVGL